MNFAESSEEMAVQVADLLYSAAVDVVRGSGEWPEVAKVYSNEFLEGLK